MGWWWLLFLWVSLLQHITTYVEPTKVIYVDAIVQKSTGVSIHVCGNIILIDDNHTTHHIVNPTLPILITNKTKSCSHYCGSPLSLVYICIYNASMIKPFKRLEMSFALYKLLTCSSISWGLLKYIHVKSLYIPCFSWILLLHITALS